MIVTRNNKMATDTPPSDWFPNLESKLDALGPENKAEVLLAFRRLREDTQRNDERLSTLEKRWAAPTPPPPTGGILNTFTELNIGSPASPDGAVRIRFGRGTPEAVIEGSAFKDIWFRVDAAGITTFMYVKTSGEGKTGWTASAL